MKKITPPVSTGYKFCFQCDDEHPVAEFYLSKTTPDGLFSECKSSMRARAAANRVGKGAANAAYARRWRMEHPGYWRTRRARDPEKWLSVAMAGNQRAKARKRAAPGEGFNAVQWSALKKEYGGRCAYCANKTKLTVEHVEPLSRGGAHDVSNIVPACRECNSGKCDRTILVWLATRAAA